jgi:hypothetical protein
VVKRGPAVAVDCVEISTGLDQNAYSFLLSLNREGTRNIKYGLGGCNDDRDWHVCTSPLVMLS